MKVQCARAAVRAALAACSVRPQMELRFLGGRGLRVTSQAGGPSRVVIPGPRGIAPVAAQGVITGSKGRPGSRGLCRRPPLPAPASPGLHLGPWALARLHDRQEGV
jgi:hypothetical protein